MAAYNNQFTQLGLTRGDSALYLGKALAVGRHSTNLPTGFCYAL